MIWPIVTIMSSHRGKTNILPHLFEVLSVVCEADTISAKSGMSPDVTRQRAKA